MKLYMATVDVCPSWGTDVYLLGIFSSLEEAQKVCEKYNKITDENEEHQNAVVNISEVEMNKEYFHIDPMKKDGMLVLDECLACYIK